MFFSLTADSQSTKGTYHDLLQAVGVQPPPTTKNFTVDTVNILATVDTLAPARGANSFYGSSTANAGQAFQIPVAVQNQIAIDDDTRFMWADLQPTSAGVFNWSSFDAAFQSAIDLGRRQSFGLVTVCTDCGTFGNPVVGGFKLGYPTFLHTQMQAEATKDWGYDAGGGNAAWIPNWNSLNYRNAYRAFLTAIRDHINTTSYKGVPFSSVVYKIDIRGVGNYGEWHFFPWINCGCIPAGTMPTEASLDSIASMHYQVFPNTWLIGNINMLVDNNMPSNFGYYFLTHANNLGASGIRCDHLANIGTVNFDTIVLASRTVNGLNFKTAFYTRFLTAPMNGEPMNDVAAVSQGGPYPYYDLDREVRLWHLSQFSNVSSSADANTQTMFRTASKSAGYKMKVRGGTVSTNIPSGGVMQLTLNWANSGIAPVYENWNVQIQLRNGGGVVAWTGQSGITLRLFLPSGATVPSTDNFLLPGLPAGTYTLEVTVIDPLGYRKPFPLYQHGLVLPGSYALTTINII